MRRPVAAMLLVACLIGLYDLTQNRFLRPEAGTNFVPFRAILHDVRHGGRDLAINLAGNVAAFVPLGMLFAAAWPGRPSIARVVAACFAVSLLIEALQYRSGHRVADVDDLILNVAGGALGGLAALRFLLGGGHGRTRRGSSAFRA